MPAHAKWWIITIAMMLVIQMASAEIDVIVNSYEPDSNRALIQVQNSGEQDLHNVYYTINSFPKQFLVNTLSAGASNILLESLNPGEHTVTIESDEETTTKTIFLANTEQRLLEEKNQDTPKTASQLGDDYEAQQQAKASSVDMGAQKKLLEQIREKNRKEQEEKREEIEMQQQELLEQLASDVAENTIVKPENAEKEFVVTKSSNPQLFVIIGIILLVMAPFAYYIYNKKNERL